MYPNRWTIRAHWLSSFPDVQDELQQEDVQQNPDLMEDVLNRLAKWQEDAERVNVYDMDAKIQRIMDVMGFMSRLVDTES